MDVVIIGAGSHGRDLFWICQAAGLNVVEVLDDNEALGFRPGSRVQTLDHRIGYLVGVNSPDVRCQYDYRRLAATALHPGAHIGPNFTADPGSVVADGVTIGNDVHLGRHVHINQASSLVRCTVGDYSSIAPGVHIAGDVTIGKGVFVGIGARISNGLTIGDGATIGAGAVVVNDVPPLATVVGVPARPLAAVA